MSGTKKSRRRDLIGAIVLGTVFPAVLVAIGFLQQSRLGDALNRAWLVAVLAFVVGALTVALPKRFPLVASLVAVLAFAGISLYTPFDAIALICCVLAGFFFGLGVRSAIYQRTTAKSLRGENAEA